MKKVERQFIAIESPMGVRNGAGFHPCQGLYFTPVGERPKIKLPALVIQSLADTGVFPGDAKNIYDLLGSTDKKLELTQGDHYLSAPANARDKHADMIADWLGQRLYRC